MARWALDELGRDMLSRLILAPDCRCLWELSRWCSPFIGRAIGIIAGYTGGKTNTVIMRTVDVFYAFPSVPLAIALSGSVVRAGIGNALLSPDPPCFVLQVARDCQSVTAPCGIWTISTPPGHWRQRVDHYPRPKVGQRARMPIFVFSAG